MARNDDGHFTLVAEEGGTLVGTIQFSFAAHVRMLFVDPDHTRKGIARDLFEAALERGEVAASRTITVNSSNYAVDVYRRLGFEVCGDENDYNGIISVPMQRMGVRDE